MPQMMPLMWLFIFSLSIMSLLMMIFHLFFFNSPLSFIKSNYNKTSLMNYPWYWKW